MNSLFLSPSSLLSVSSIQCPPALIFKPQHIWTNCYAHQGHHFSFLPRSSMFFPNGSSRAHKLSIVATAPKGTAPEGTVPVADIEDFNEKDWSFLDFDNSDSEEAFLQKIDQIISAGEIVETSRVLVSIGSEGFVDRLVESSPHNPTSTFVVHESIFVLAGIKEKFDDVRCLEGEITCVPEAWAPLDVIFLYFLPALPLKLGEALRAIAGLCSPGARVVISHPQGRGMLEQQRQQYPDTVISDLPDKLTLQKVAAEHCFDIAEYVDEPDFYLSVLKHHEARK